jgi:hypothetical protein
VRYSTKADYQPFSEGYWADEKRRTFPLQNTYAEVGRNKKELKAQTTLIPVPLFLNLASDGQDLANGSIFSLHYNMHLGPGRSCSGACPTRRRCVKCEPTR